MITPGTAPVDGYEGLAEDNLGTFLAEVQAEAAELESVPIRHRVAGLSGDPVRDPAADRDGRFGWDLPFSDGRVVRLLMPGVELQLLREDLTAGAPCLYVNGNALWWAGAVTSVAGEGMALKL